MTAASTVAAAAPPGPERPAPRDAIRRRPMIGTSWKMNLLPSTAPAWFEAVVRGAAGATDRELFVLPPYPMLAAAQLSLAGSPIRWGAQDVHAADGGAHTGDVSAPMLVDLGCTIAEIGHSERRRDHGESDARIAAKVATALRWQLTPLLCVGERAPGPANRAVPVVARQLTGALGALSEEELNRVVVAYEPVWAIGEGSRAAGLDHVGTLHAAIRRWLDNRGGVATRVLYGGSVDRANAPGLLSVPEVDGLFVGRAALDPDVFVAIATLPVARREAWS
jgi:triosephosphate isomerase